MERLAVPTERADAVAIEIVAVAECGSPAGTPLTERRAESAL